MRTQSRVVEWQRDSVITGMNIAFHKSRNEHP